MAKSDSFFIRAKIDTNGTTFAQTSIDLGAYVDALGKSVLRVRNISVKYGDGLDVPTLAGGTTNTTAYQLTTQSQSQIVLLDDKSLIASGCVTYSNGSTGAGGLTVISESHDMLPQHWTNGYLIGVEQIYLATDSAGAASVGEVSICLECTVETLSQNAAMALALSQQ